MISRFKLKKTDPHEELNRPTAEIPSHSQGDETPTTSRKRSRSESVRFFKRVRLAIEEAPAIGGDNNLEGEDGSTSLESHSSSLNDVGQPTVGSEWRMEFVEFPTFPEQTESIEPNILENSEDSECKNDIEESIPTTNSPKLDLEVELDQICKTNLEQIEESKKEASEYPKETDSINQNPIQTNQSSPSQVVCDNEIEDSKVESPAIEEEGEQNSKANYKLSKKGKSVQEPSTNLAPEPFEEDSEAMKDFLAAFANFAPLQRNQEPDDVEKLKIHSDRDDDSKSSSGEQNSKANYKQLNKERAVEEPSTNLAPEPFEEDSEAMKDFLAAFGKFAPLLRNQDPENVEKLEIHSDRNDDSKSSSGEQNSKANYKQLNKERAVEEPSTNLAPEPFEEDSEAMKDFLAAFANFAPLQRNQEPDDVEKLDLYSDVDDDSKSSSGNSNCSSVSKDTSSKHHEISDSNIESSSESGNELRKSFIKAQTRCATDELRFKSKSDNKLDSADSYEFLGEAMREIEIADEATDDNPIDRKKSLKRLKTKAKLTKRDGSSSDSDSIRDSAEDTDLPMNKKKQPKLLSNSDDSDDFFGPHKLKSKSKSKRDVDNGLDFYEDDSLSEDDRFSSGGKSYNEMLNSDLAHATVLNEYEELFHEVNKIVNQVPTRYKFALNTVLYPTLVVVYLRMIASGKFRRGKAFVESTQHYIDNTQMPRLDKLMTLQCSADLPRKARKLLAGERQSRIRIVLCEQSCDVLESFVDNWTETKQSIFERHFKLIVEDNAGVPSQQSRIPCLTIDKVYWATSDTFVEPTQPSPRALRRNRLKRTKLSPVKNKHLPIGNRLYTPLTRRWDLELQKDEEEHRVPLSSDNLPSVYLYNIFEQTETVICATFSSKNTMVAMGTKSGRVHVTTLTTDKLLQVKSARNLEKLDTSIPGIDERMMDDANQTTIRKLYGHQGPVYGCAFEPHDRFLLTSSQDRTVRCWCLFTWSCVVIYPGHMAAIYSVCYAPLGYYFATASDDRTARIWTQDSRKSLFVLIGHLAEVICCTFHPNRHYLATGSADCTVRLWDCLKGVQVRLFSGHRDDVNALAFSICGRYLVTGSDDHYIIVWDIETEHLVHALSAHTAGIKSIVFALDSKLFMAGGQEGQLTIWNFERLVQEYDSDQIKKLSNSKKNTSQFDSEDLLLKSFFTKGCPFNKLQVTSRNLVLAISITTVEQPMHQVVEEIGKVKIKNFFKCRRKSTKSKVKEKPSNDEKLSILNMFRLFMGLEIEMPTPEPPIPDSVVDESDQVIDRDIKWTKEYDQIDEQIIDGVDCSPSAVEQFEHFTNEDEDQSINVQDPYICKIQDNQTDVAGENEKEKCENSTNEANIEWQNWKEFNQHLEKRDDEFSELSTTTDESSEYSDSERKGTFNHENIGVAHWDNQRPEQYKSNADNQPTQRTFIGNQTKSHKCGVGKQIRMSQSEDSSKDESSSTTDDESSEYSDSERKGTFNHENIGVAHWGNQRPEQYKSNADNQPTQRIFIGNQTKSHKFGVGKQIRMSQSENSSKDESSSTTDDESSERSSTENESSDTSATDESYSPRTTDDECSDFSLSKDSRANKEYRIWLNQTINYSKETQMTPRYGYNDRPDFGTAKLARENFSDSDTSTTEESSDDDSDEDETQEELNKFHKAKQYFDNRNPNITSRLDQNVMYAMKSSKDASDGDSTREAESSDDESDENETQYFDNRNPILTSRLDQNVMNAMKSSKDASDGDSTTQEESSDDESDEDETQEDLNESYNSKQYFDNRNPNEEFSNADGDEAQHRLTKAVKYATEKFDKSNNSKQYLRPNLNSVDSNITLHFNQNLMQVNQGKGESSETDSSIEEESSDDDSEGDDAEHKHSHGELIVKNTEEESKEYLMSNYDSANPNINYRHYQNVKHVKQALNGSSESDSSIEEETSDDTSDGATADEKNPLVKNTQEEFNSKPYFHYRSREEPSDSDSSRTEESTESCSTEEESSDNEKYESRNPNITRRDNQNVMHVEEASDKPSHGGSSTEEESSDDDSDGEKADEQNVEINVRNVQEEFEEPNNSKQCLRPHFDNGNHNISSRLNQNVKNAKKSPEDSNEIDSSTEEEDDTHVDDTQHKPANEYKSCQDNSSNYENNLATCSNLEDSKSSDSDRTLIDDESSSGTDDLWRTLNK